MRPAGAKSCDHQGLHAALAGSTPLDWVRRARLWPLRRTYALTATRQSIGSIVRVEAKKIQKIPARSFCWTVNTLGGRPNEAGLWLTQITVR